MSGGITTSPWVFQCVDRNNVPFKATFNFTTGTRALTSCVVARNAGCLYTNLWLGLGSDGTPNATVNTFNAPSAITNLSAATLAADGLATIDNVLAIQITCG